MADYKRRLLQKLLPGILLACIYLGNAFSQDALFIQNFIGSWQGKGKLFGATAEFEMHWEWVLENKFVRLTFQNKMQRSDSMSVVLMAQAYYQPKSVENYSGTWFDSRGMVLPLKATAEDSALTTHWGTPETEQGKTVYRLTSKNNIEVTDFVLKNDAWQPFGNAVYSRNAKD